MAAFGNSPFGQAAMAAALRQPYQPPAGGGTVSGGAMGGLRADSGTGDQVSQRGQQYSNPLDSSSANNIAKYLRGMMGSGGPTAAAGQAAMPEMAAGGGSSLGSMGLMQPAVSFPGAPAAGGGGAAAGGGMSGALGAGGGLAGLAALSFLGDREMNENPNSVINADKLNDMGSVNGIGLRAGDLVNGFNPATWMSDPKKAAKGLGNAFTFGLLDKIF